MNPRQYFDGPTFRAMCSAIRSCIPFDSRRLSARKAVSTADVRATLVMMRTPDGQGIELDKFHTPNAIRFGPADTPVNALGLRRIMFAVDDINDVAARVRAHSAELIGQMRYEESYRLAYIRGPEGIIVGLAEQLGYAWAPRSYVRRPVLSGVTVDQLSYAA